MTRHHYLALLRLCLTLGLLYPASPASATDTLDQSQTVSQSSKNVTYSTQQAQIFTAGLYGTLDRVSLRLENFTNSPPTGAVLNVSIQTVIAGLPSGKQIGSGTIALSAIPALGSGGGWVDVNIRGAVVQAGTQYALVLQTSIWNAEVYWWYAYQNQYGSSYTRGVMAFNYGSGWSTYGIYDFTFKTYLIPDVLDRSQTQSWLDYFALESTMAQIFTPAQTGVIDRVTAYLGNGLYRNWPIGTGPIEASIQTVKGGYPSGIVIGQGSIPPPAVADDFSNEAWYTIGISDAPVIAGTQYALVLHEGSGVFYWNYAGSINYMSLTAPPFPGGYMMKYACVGCSTSPFSGGNWELVRDPLIGNPTYAMFQTYVLLPVASASSPPPATITPCSSGVCPAVVGSVTPPDSTARVTSNVQFQELTNGTVHGILNFNDSKTGNFVLQGCTTTSAACRLTVTTFACIDQHAITVAGTLTPKGETAINYLLTLGGVRDGIGIFTLTAGDYSYTLTRKGIVNVTCPPVAGVVF